MEKKRLFAVIWPLRNFVQVYDSVEKDKITGYWRDWLETDTERFIAITHYEAMYWYRFDGYLTTYEYCDYFSRWYKNYKKYREIADNIIKFYLVDANDNYWVQGWDDLKPDTPSTGEEWDESDVIPSGEGRTKKDLKDKEEEGLNSDIHSTESGVTTLL